MAKELFQIALRIEDVIVIADPNVEAVDICLPTDLHPSVSTAALAAGKHVFCEKPMALREADCELMIEAARKAKRVLMVGQVLRFWPEYMALQEFGGSQKYVCVSEKRDFSHFGSSLIVAVRTLR